MDRAEPPAPVEAAPEVMDVERVVGGDGRQLLLFSGRPARSDHTPTGDEPV